MEKEFSREMHFIKIKKFHSLLRVKCEDGSASESTGVSPEYFWMLIVPPTRKKLLTENLHFRAEYFSSCQVGPPIVLSIETAPGNRVSKFANCISDGGF